MACITYFLLGPIFIEAQASSYFWPGKNGDVIRTGFSQYGKISIAKGPAWSRPDLGLTRAAPLIDDMKNIYISTIFGDIYKFSPDGDVLWEYHPSAYNASTMISEIGYLYEGSMYVQYGLMVSKFDMETGELQWRKSPDKSGIADHDAIDTWSLSAGEGVLLTAFSANKYPIEHADPRRTNTHQVGMSAETGDVLWTYATHNPCYNNLLSIKDGFVFFSDFTGKAYKLNLKTGKEVWVKGGLPGTVSGGGTIYGPNHVIYTTHNAGLFKSVSAFAPTFAYQQGGQTLHGRIDARDPEDGTLLWQAKTNYAASNAVSIGWINGRWTVVAGVGENPGFPVRGSGTSMPDNSSFLAVKKHRMVAYDAETGSELWKYELPLWHGWGAGEESDLSKFCGPDAWSNSAIAGDGTVYAGNQDGNFYAISDKNDDGEIGPDEVVTYYMGRCSQGSPAIAPGMIVAAPCNGIHVFKDIEGGADAIFM